MEADGDRNPPVAVLVSGDARGGTKLTRAGETPYGSRMNQPLLTPVFILIALTFALLFWMGGARFMAVSDRAVRIKDIALGQQAWPPRVTKIDRSFHNQLELPLLFYALVALAIGMDIQSTLLVTLEWLFVALRLVHAGIHVTTNHLLARFAAFVAGALVLLIMWIWFAARVYFGP